MADIQTVSYVNFWTRLWANLIFLFAVFLLALFGVGGNEWTTGFAISAPFFIWACGLTFKANHTAVIRGSNGKRVKKSDSMEDRLTAMEKAMNLR